MRLKDKDNVVIWSEIVIALKEDLVEEFKSGSVANARTLKSLWKRRVEKAAEELSLIFRIFKDNWTIIENRIQQDDLQPQNTTDVENRIQQGKSDYAVSDDLQPQNTSDDAELLTSSSGRSKSSSNSSKSSLLGYKLNITDKKKILDMFQSLSKEKMRRLSSGRYVEEIMHEFNQILNYEQ